MATQPTNLPVPSESPRDLKFNAGKIDEFVTSIEREYEDRFGNKHYTIEGLRWIAQQAISEFGYITLDSFEDGNTLTLPNQVLRLEATGEYYRWDGALPKEVPAGSTPESTGGVGEGAWLSIGDASLRPVTQFRTNTIATLQESSFNIGDFISVGGYYNVGDGANHFRVISDSDDGSGVQIANGLWANIVHSGEVHVSWFGAVSGSEDGAENLPDASQSITKAFNYYRYNLKFDPAWYRLSSSIPIGSHASFSTSSGNGQQWPINNVFWFVLDSNVERIWDVTLTNDNVLRDFKISNFRFSPASKWDGSVIYSDMPLGPFEISHIHIDNASYFLKNTISDREPSNIGQFLSMGSRINIIDSFIRADYTMYCDKGVAGSLWSNHNNVTRSTISSFYIEAGCQNWRFDSCLYETWDKEMFYSPLRAENLQFISMYIEGITSATNTAVPLAEWNTAKTSGTLIRTVNDYSSSTPVQYSVYLYNDIWYCGNESGSDVSSTSAKDYVSIIKVDGPANISFEHCLFANFQSLFRTNSQFFASDIYVRDCSFFDNAAKVNTHAPYLFVEASDRLINVYHDSGLSTQKRFSNRPVFLRSPSNIKTPESYNETRTSGNATLRTRVNINSPVLYVTTNQANSGRGYSEAEPLLVSGNFSDFIKGIDYHSRIVAVNAQFTVTSLIDIDFPFDLEMKAGSGIYVTASTNLPYINAEKGFRLTGGIINFSGNLTDTTFDYLIGKGKGVYEFANVSITNSATKNVSLIYNDSSNVPIAVRIYNVSTVGTVYASKNTLLPQTSSYSIGSGVLPR